MKIRNLILGPARWLDRNELLPLAIVLVVALAAAVVVKLHP